MEPSIEERVKKLLESQPNLSEGLRAIMDKIQTAVAERFDDKTNHIWAWIEEVFDSYLIFQMDNKYYRIEYNIPEGGAVQLAADYREVKRTVKYEGDRSKLKRIEARRATGQLYKEAEFDDESLVIRNVTLIGAESLNGYSFSSDFLKWTAQEAEGVPQYIDHPEKEGDSRKVNMLFSKVQNAQYMPNENKVRGDMHLVDTPYIRNEIYPRMKHFKEKIGNSIIAWAVSEEIEGKEVVTAGDRIHSFDLVTDPATTVGLFEGIRDDNKESGGSTMPISIEDVKKDVALMEAIRAEILKESEDKKRVETLEKENKYLKEQNQAKDVEIDTYKTKEALESKRALITKLVAEAKLPKEAAREDWLKLIEEKCADETDIRRMIDDKAAFVKAITEDVGNPGYDPHKVIYGGGDAGNKHEVTLDQLAEFDRNAF